MAALQTEFITFKQLVAQCAGLLSEPTLRRYVQSGRIPKIQLAGRKGKILVPANAMSQLKFSEATVAERCGGIRATAPERNKKPARWVARLPGINLKTQK